VGDFNGDGYADVLWFNPNSGALAEWLLDGQGNVISTPILSRTWTSFHKEVSRAASPTSSVR
jgi:hypothetical protein